MSEIMDLVDDAISKFNDAEIISGDKKILKAIALAAPA